MSRRTVAAFLFVLFALVPAVAEVSLPKPIEDADYLPFDDKRAALGRLLFYDKILSGNRNIACGTCHDHDHGTTDGLSLGVGEGGVGAGPNRRFGTGRDRAPKRVPRNANALFNIGHKDFRVLFHDGRTAIDDAFGNGFSTPAEEWLPEGLGSLAAVQALFPVTSPTEMAGQPGENEIAAAGRERIDHIWPRIAARVRRIPEYVALFRSSFPNEVKTPGDVTMPLVANAIGDFITSEWRSDDAPFDDFLKGRSEKLSPAQLRGWKVFGGKGRCLSCHGGALLTDQKFHALALPPFGPGRTRRFDPYARDVGRMAETDDPADAYRFRTPSLRNVALTGPYGHNGAYRTLEGIVRHHLEPLVALRRWSRSEPILPAEARFAETDFAVWEDEREMARLRVRVDIEPVTLTDGEVADVVAFLHSLTGRTAATGRLGKPEGVPSGLPVDDDGGVWIPGTAPGDDELGERVEPATGNPAFGKAAPPTPHSSSPGAVPGIHRASTANSGPLP